MKRWIYLTQPPRFVRNDLVEVRSAAEIAATLDADGSLDGLPFMPEMLAYCGQRIAVHRRADRTCVGELGFRRMHATVFLQEARCDGSAHDGCDRACLLFWKEAWLKPVDGRQTPAAAANGTTGAHSAVSRRDGRCVCQSTELLRATTGAVSPWDPRPLLREVAVGELSPDAFMALLLRTLLRRLRRLVGMPVSSLAGPPGKKSRGALGLRAGDWVEVKSANEVARQLDPAGANCGMLFRPAMQASLGGRYEVAFPVRRIISEETGAMVELKNTVALKNVTCHGPCVAHCPRNEYLYWRESWLERASD